jgi:site-specific DNA recombinase
MTAVQAAIYCRMSLAIMDDTTKVEDQERQCRERCRQLGWDVTEVFVDNSRSAWQRARKRPGWDRMLAAVAAGRVSAICTYWGDRLARQPRDLEDLIDLGWDSKGRQRRDLLYASVAGTYDLNNPDHVMMMRWDVARACNESDTISRRKKNQYERYRREGRVRPGGPGGRSFGFESDNLTPVAAELDLVREAAARILAGESLNSVCRDWDARGLTATTGKPWRRGNLGPMLKLPRYAGLMPDGESAAAWPAALERETWERLRLVLDARAGFSNPAPANARKWLLSGIAVCGPCGQPLQIGKSAGGRDAWSYSCAAKGCGKVRRNAAHLDAYVSSAVVKRLVNPFNPEARAVPADHAAEWAALERDRAETDGLLTDYRLSAGNARSLLARLDAIDARMAELRELAAGGTRARLLEQYAGTTREEWKELALDIRRALVAAYLTVTVLPASVRGPGFQEQDVRLEPVS